MQQYLPFTVLKPSINVVNVMTFSSVATVLTVYGIETKDLMPMACPLGPPVATAPTVYGIETCTLNQ